MNPADNFATHTVPVASLGLDFEILSNDSIIGPSIAGGSWADEETRLFCAHLEPGCKVVDLGANVGWFAVQAILAGAEVHAFEPVPAIAQIAERNMRRAEAVAQKNGLPGKGVLHPYAAGSETSSAKIALAAENHGDNRVVEGEAAPDDMGSSDLVEIQIRAVDDLVKGPIRFLKVDTQGSEWLALQGAKQLLEQSPDLAMLIEFWPYALRGIEPLKLLLWLSARGFSMSKATDAPFVMAPERVHAQVSRRDPVRGGIDLYCVRGNRPFHVLGKKARLKGMARSLKED